MITLKKSAMKYKDSDGNMQDVGAVIGNNGNTGDIPKALPNPHALTFTGAVTGTYDGSQPLEIEIPSGGSGGETETEWTYKKVTLEEDVSSIFIEIPNAKRVIYRTYLRGNTADNTLTTSSGKAQTLLNGAPFEINELFYRTGSGYFTYTEIECVDEKLAKIYKMNTAGNGVAWSVANGLNVAGWGSLGSDLSSARNIEIKTFQVSEGVSIKSGSYVEVWYK